MNKRLNTKKGFTLIELLVVVAIISLLASIVLASLKNARAKSKDSFLREQATQMRILLEQEYNDTGSYANLQPATWATTTGDCDGLFGSSSYVTEARLICKAIITNSSTLTWNGSIGATRLFVGNGINNSTKYSILVALPYKDAFLCLGSSGSISDDTDTIAETSAWGNAGCWGNP